jgi:putative heme iron utilization protein
MLKQILEDLLKIDDILFIVKNQGVTSEIKGNFLTLRQKENWITIGDEKGPCHMHINTDYISKAKFVIEEKVERTSYSVMFFEKNDERVLAAFFTKMYDEDKKLNQKRKALFDNLFNKYGKQETIMIN